MSGIAKARAGISRVIIPDEFGNLFTNNNNNNRKSSSLSSSGALVVIEGLCFIILVFERKRSRKRKW
ncbi:MAG: hypothetical protein M3275_13945 [Thermoproteota archaeon]|nr:hypothetical protein [Thermoproteota archaeon]